MIQQLKEALECETEELSLKPLHEALVECVDNLKYMEELWHRENGPLGPITYSRALTNLAKVLKEMGYE